MPVDVEEWFPRPLLPSRPLERSSQWTMYEYLNQPGDPDDRPRPDGKAEVRISDLCLTGCCRIEGDTFQANLTNLRVAYKPFACARSLSLSLPLFLSPKTVLYEHCLANRSGLCFHPPSLYRALRRTVLFKQELWKKMPAFPPGYMKADRGRELIGVSVALDLFEILMVIARLLAQRRRKAPLGADDYIITPGLVCTRGFWFARCDK